MRMCRRSREMAAASSHLVTFINMSLSVRQCLNSYSRIIAVKRLVK
jgi:hypothetical protein